MVIDELVFKIQADMKDAQRDIAAMRQQMTRAEGGAKKLVNQFKQFAGIAGAAVVVQQITRAVVQFGKEAIEAASAAEEIRSKFNVVFKDSARDVEAWARSFSNAMGRSTTENMSFLASIQDTLVPLGLARDEAAEMSQAVVALATDLSSFNNLPTEQVIADIQSALVGNTETLRKYGVVATQTAIEQLALAEGIDATGDGLDATEKAVAVYAKLVADTADAQGDAARTSGSWANQNRRAEASVTDLKEEVGILLQEGFRPLKDAFTDVVDILGNMVGGLNNARRSLDAFHEAMDDPTAENQVEMFDALQKQVDDARQALEQYDSSLVQQAFAGLTGQSGTYRTQLAAQVAFLERQLDAAEGIRDAAEERLATEQRLTEEAEAQAAAAEAQAQAIRDAWAAEQKRLDDLEAARTELSSERAASNWVAGILESTGVIDARETMEREIRSLENEIESLVSLGYNAMRGGQVYDTLDAYRSATGFTDYGGETFRTEAGDEQLLVAIERLREIRAEYQELYGDVDDVGEGTSRVTEELSAWDELYQQAIGNLQEQTEQAYLRAEVERQLREAMEEGDQKRWKALREMAEILGMQLDDVEQQEEITKGLAAITSDLSKGEKRKLDLQRQQSRELREQERLLKEQQEAIGLIQDIVRDVFGAQSIQEGAVDIARSVASMLPGPEGAVLDFMADIFGWLVELEKVAKTAPLIADTQEAVADLFADVLDGEELLRDERLQAIEDELEAARRAHDEQMSLLDSKYSTEQRILQERYERGLIDEGTFREQAAELSTEQAAEVGAVNDALTAAEDDEETRRKFEENKRSIASGLKGEIKNLIREFNRRFSGVGNEGGFDSYAPNTFYPLILSTWGTGDELLYEEINRMKEDLEQVEGASTPDELAALGTLPSFATGGSFVTTGEQLIRVGEAGPERVDIRPVNTIAEGMGSGGGGITVVVERAYGIDDLAGQVGEALERRIRRGVGVRE